LDISNNRITDINGLLKLGQLKSLNAINVEGNPFLASSFGDLQDFMARNLQHVKLYDDHKVHVAD